MTAPYWLNEILRDFGRSIGLKDFSLGDQDAAVMRFENGIAMRFEYALESLVIAAEVQANAEPQNLKKLLTYTLPERVSSFAIRTAYLADKRQALLLTRLSERDLTLPLIVSVFTELFHLAEDFRNRLS